MKSSVLKNAVLAIISACVIEFLFLVQFDGFFNSFCGYEHFRYKPEELVYINASLDADNIVINGWDPQIHINDINTYVYGVEAKLKKISNDGVPVSVYYDVGEGFSEKYRVNGACLANREAVIIRLNEEIQNLRLDIGTDSYDTYEICEVVINPVAGDYAWTALLCMVPERLIIYFMVIFLLLCLVSNYEKTVKYCFRNRWLIGAGIIILGTLLGLNGSSIGYLSNLIGGFDSSKIIGTPRGIRSDEYVLFTEMALSQKSTGFHWFSDIWGYSPSDMFMVYGQPVLNLVSIFRPFSIAYIFLGSEQGLAFYWVSRMIVLFLVSFEFGRLITNDDRCLSLVYSFLIAFSPIVQWWYSINELVETLIFGQLTVLILFFYIKETSYFRKVIYILGLVICAVGYVLVLYPPWMIPFFFVFVICAVNMLIDNRKSIIVRKVDIIFFTIGLVIILGSLVYIFQRSGDTIRTVMNSVYPGRRKYYGGPMHNFVEIFRGWSSWIWTFTENGNPCEDVDFISFFPLGVIMSVSMFIRHKVKDRWLITLNILNLLLIVYLCVKLPAMIGKVTLLEHSTSRLINAVGFINVLILVRATGQIKWSKALSKAMLIATCIGAVLSTHTAEDILSPQHKGIIFITAILFCILFIAYIKSPTTMRRIMISSFIILGIIGGGMVNPVNIGLGSIYNTKLVNNIRRINESDKGLWAVEGNFIISNLPTIVGADTLTATAVYPDREMWEKLGLESEEEVWNRYAFLTISDSDSVYTELNQTVWICLHIPVEKLRELGVTYILSDKDYDNNTMMNCLYRDDSYGIWEISDE